MSTSSLSFRSYAHQFPPHQAAVAAGEPSNTCVWNEVTIRTCAMPHHMELCVAPPVPALTLGVLRAGSMHLETRHTHGPWHRQMVCQGDLSLRPVAHEPHEIRWRSRSVEPIQALEVYMHQDWLLRVAEEVAEHDGAHLTFVECVGFQDPLLMQLGLALGQELKQPTPIDSLYVQTAAHTLAVHLIRFYTDRNAHICEPKRGLTARQVQRVRDYVQSHIRHDLTLAVLAQQINLSAYHFARMFRQTMGDSPHQFVLRQRIERAQWLLRTTDMPIVDIAAECGFANQSYLTTVFRRRLGLTPRAYRRLVQ